jgi:hypothetical protein
MHLIFRSSLRVCCSHAEGSQVLQSGGAGVLSALGRPAVRLLLLAALGFGGATLLQGQGAVCFERY